MKIQYCSDLHLEFRENKEFLEANPIKPVGDIFILAGDIVPFALMRKHADFFNYLADHFEYTYWVPGNHEYYRGDIATRSGTFTENIRDNVIHLNNQVVNLNRLKLVFSTLWTTLGPSNQQVIRQGLSDFHAIKANGTEFLPDHYNGLHEDCKDFLGKALSKENPDTTLVITHHIPTCLNYPEKYKGDILNEAFAVELSELISDNGPDYWIYGHHHMNIHDFVLKRTRLLTNQLGYVQNNEDKSFKTNLSFNIDLQDNKPIFAQ